MISRLMLNIRDPKLNTSYRVTQTTGMSDPSQFLFTSYIATDTTSMPYTTTGGGTFTLPTEVEVEAHPHG